MKNEGKTALAHLTASAEKEFCAFLAQQTPEAYEDAVALIEECRAAGHRVHVTGIGKPGHVAGYGASLLSSTGTPSYFLHGTEAVHGSCGRLEEGDVVIAISNSGETVELKATVLAVKNNSLPRHRHHRQCGKLARKGERRAAARACRRRGRPAQPRAAQLRTRGDVRAAGALLHIAGGRRADARAVCPPPPRRRARQDPR